MKLGATRATQKNLFRSNLAVKRVDFATNGPLQNLDYSAQTTNKLLKYIGIYLF